MIKCEFKNKNKMKKYLEENIGEISDEQFNEYLDYFIEAGEYIKSECDIDRVQQKANLSIDYNDDEYEVCIKYNQIVKNNEAVYIIDFDYDYEIDSI